MILKDTEKLFGFRIKTLAQKVSSTKNLSDLLTVLRTSKSAELRSTTSTKVVEQQAVAPRSYPDDLASVEAEFEALLAPENQHKTTAVEEESVRVKQEDKQLQPRLEKTSSTDEKQGPFYFFVDGRSLRRAKGFRYVKSEHPEKAHTLAYMKEVLFGAIRDEAAQQQSADVDRGNNLTEGADQLPPQPEAKRRRIDG
ncbi:unnamed protein product [Amoebophrya sp. A25]|nr:unnamed protein product [Amoebophrya sp. A25]|eukprot:GSA25T00019872001.1